MILSNILKSILNTQRKVDIKYLPSQGLFYKDDLEMWIRKAKIEDIIEYEHNFNKEDLGSVINRVKRIVEKNVILSKDYSFNDVKSIDIVYIFFEIVKFTNNKEIDVKFYNELIGKDDTINFSSQNFNYTNLSKEISESYDSQTKEFVIDGFRYSLPCIGIENSLSYFLIDKSFKPDSQSYNDYSYDFLYFLGHKNSLTFSEIDNLIQIFNFDLSDEEQKKIRKIIKSFSKIGKYSLKKDSTIIDVSAKIDLKKIWK